MDICLLKSKSIEDINSMQAIENLATQLIQQKDADGDGSLSIEETGFPQQIQDKLDLDGNGKLNEEEVKNGIAGIKDAIFNFTDFARAVQNNPPDMNQFKDLLSGMSSTAKEPEGMAAFNKSMNSLLNQK